MSLDTIIASVKRLFQDKTRKRQFDEFGEGPAQKFIKISHERRSEVPNSFRDEVVRNKTQMRIPKMGSILSKFKSNINSCEPIEHEEFSDGEDVIFVAKFKKNILPSQPIQINNIQHQKMDGINGSRCSSITRPIPSLISRNKFSRVPDLQKCYKPSQNINFTRPTLVNGYRSENETTNIKCGLVNGNCTTSFKPPINHYTGSTCFSRNVSNYFNSTNSHLHVAKQSDNAEKMKYEQLLKNAEDGQDFKVKPLLWRSSSRSSVNQNHFPSPRPPIRRSSNIHLVDDDFNQKTEDAIRLLSESSIDKEHKVTPVNSMRLKHESLLVYQNSFPDNVNEKYSLAQRQRQERISEAKEKGKEISSTLLLERRSYVNRLPIWEPKRMVIFDEDIEERIDDFPEFTDDQRTFIQKAMNGHPHTVLITKFNITITRDYIRTLQWEPLAWLNDEVINFYMSLLTERGDLRSSDGYPKVYAMNTFFTQRLSSGGYSAVRRWTKKVDIFACDIIPVPVHVGNVHWCMAIINMKEKTIKYYDSMGSPNHRVLSALEQYLKEESMDKRKVPFDFSGWNTENVTDNPRQQNGSDCGVFSCMTAEFVCRNRPIVFNQQHMNYFRQKMVLEICTGKMLL